MKKILLTSSLFLGLFAGSVTLTSCDRANDAIDNIAIPLPFDIPVSYTTDIPFASVKTDSYLTYPEIKMDLDVNSEIKKRYPQLSVNNLKSVKLSAINIELVSSTYTKLDAVQNAKLYIKTPTLEKTLAATVENNTGTDKIVFTPTDAELIEYFKSPQNSIVLEIQGRKLSLDKFTIKINPTFKIAVGV